MRYRVYVSEVDDVFDRSRRTDTVLVGTEQECAWTAYRIGRMIWKDRQVWIVPEQECWD